MPPAIDITFAGQPLTLLPERAVLHPPSSTLFLSDLHLGKPASYRALAAPVPESVTDADLARLSALLTQHRPDHLCILGDLLHDSHYTSPETLSRLLTWRAAHASLHISLILGNHDLRAGSPHPSLNISAHHPPHSHHAFTLLHDPADAHPDHFSLAGHLHPAARLAPASRRAGPTPLRAPCFWLSPALLILPAFSRFTGSAIITPREGERVFVTHDDTILEAPTLAPITRPRVRSRSRSAR
ncbi:MAG: ligase-associated DNA damage response endonuclease PdeM [Phycisphaerales bacterium]